MDLQEYIQSFEKSFGYKLTIVDNHLHYSGSLDLEGTGITALPEGLTVGGYLNLEGTGITALPEGLTVGGYLDLRGTGITALPEGLTVGGYLNLEGTGITDISHVNRTLTAEQLKRINNVANRTIIWEWRGRQYIKVDGEFTEIDSHRGNVYHVHYLNGKKNLLITDGDGHWAHGSTLAEARADLIYKINDRDTSAYASMSLDDELTFEEAIAAYRTITGACSAGTRNYIENRLPKPHKAKYTIREIINLTDGEYGAEKFKNFFTHPQS